MLRYKTSTSPPAYMKAYCHAGYPFRLTNIHSEHDFVFFEVSRNDMKFWLTIVLLFSSQSEENLINNKIKVVHDNFWIHVTILAKFIWYPFHQPEQKKPWHIYQNLPEPFTFENFHRKYQWHKKGLDIP